MKLFVLFFFTNLTLFGQQVDSVKIHLEEIYQENFDLRKKVMPTVREYGFDSPQMNSLDESIKHFDATSLIYVKSIIDEFGWMGKSRIGDMANQAIYLTIQHSSNSDDRIQYFPLLQQSCDEGESDKSDMATMYDRIQVEAGKDQLYGTQSRMVDGQLQLYPIEDEPNVNKRRKKVGLRKLKL
ncbi:MAG: DUF6624 domain-containing protein [Ekhidna sp.]